MPASGQKRKARDTSGSGPHKRRRRKSDKSDDNMSLRCVNSTTTCYYGKYCEMPPPEAVVHVTYGSRSQFPSAAASQMGSDGRKRAANVFPTGRIIVTGTDDSSSALFTSLQYMATIAIKTGYAAIMVSAHANNKVCTVKLPHPVDLVHASQMQFAKYESKVFPGMTLDVSASAAAKRATNVRAPNIKVAVFRGGRMNVMGSPDESELHRVYDYVVKLLEPFFIKNGVCQAATAASSVAMDADAEDDGI